jgi:hypothetical protein
VQSGERDSHGDGVDGAPACPPLGPVLPHVCRWVVPSLPSRHDPGLRPDQTNLNCVTNLERLCLILIHTPFYPLYLCAQATAVVVSHPPQVLRSRVWESSQILLFANPYRIPTCHSRKYSVVETSHYRLGTTYRSATVSISLDTDSLHRNTKESTTSYSTF